MPPLVIGPYTKRGYVSHVHPEFGSILHFSEDLDHRRGYARPTSAPITSPTVSIVASRGMKHAEVPLDNE